MIKSIKTFMNYRTNFKTRLKAMKRVLIVCYLQNLVDNIQKDLLLDQSSIKLYKDLQNLVIEVSNILCELETIQN